MVEITQQDFNKEMEKYLATRVDSSVKPAKKERTIVIDKQEELEFEKEDSEFYSIKEPWYEKILDFFIGKPKVAKVKTEEEFDEVEEQPPRQGIIQKIFGWFTTEEEFEDDEFDDVEEIKEDYIVNEDIKKLIKIQHFWVEQLPPKKIKEFKDSADYQEYRELLKKYNLIK